MPAAKLSPSTRPGAPRAKNPWLEHLRSLIGQRVVVQSMGPTELLPFAGQLIAVSDQHLNCAIRTEAGAVITLKNVHHIVSHPAARGAR